MHEDLKRYLALLKQELEQAQRIAPITSISALHELKPDQAETLKAKLRRVDLCGRKIREILKSEGTSADVPTLGIPRALWDYFHAEYEPHASRISNLSLFGQAESPSLEDLGLGDSDLSSPSSSDASLNKPIKETMEVALSRMSPLLDDPPEGLEWLSEDEIEQALSLVGLPVYFDPDGWLENMEEIRPIITSRSSSQFPEHIRIRIKEVHSSFVFGNFQSVASMSRSLLEYSILDRSGPLGIDAYYTAKSGQPRTKSLNALIANVAEVNPELKNAMSSIQEYGNMVMHPRKSKKVKELPVSRGYAIDCMTKLRDVLAAFYT